MNVLILAEQLAEPATGIGRYTAALLGTAVADPSLAVAVACTRAGAELAESLGVRADRVVRLPDPVLVRSAACLAGAGLRGHRPDLVHGTKHFVPLSGPPAVLTVHDLYALDATGARGSALRWGYSRSLDRAALLAPTNHVVAGELRERLDVGAERMCVFRPPSAATGASVELEPVAVPESFALHVSDLDARKNAGLLLDLWPEVHATTGVPLVLAGARHGSTRDLDVVDRLAATGAVIDLGPVGDAQLTWLYQHAQVLLFPSWSEGWGYPVEEALAAGCPTVSSPVPSAAGRGEPDQLLVLAPDDRAGWLAASLAALDGARVRSDVERVAAPGDGAPPPASAHGELAALYQRALRLAA
jgi:glycosyltransferase involved in cell wall biosynthesis